MDSNGRGDTPTTSTPGARRRAGGVWAKRAGLVAGGLLVGGIAAGTVSATAATSSATPSASSSSSAASTAPDGDHDGHGGGHGGALSTSGTITAVDGTTLTIKTTTGTTPYVVSSASDIDKNGEAALKDLAVGDAVRFSTVTTNGKVTIDKLHAGDEAKDMPARPSSGSDGSTTG